MAKQSIRAETLEKYLVQVRRVAKGREADVTQKILKMYKRLSKDLNGFIGNEYAKYAENDQLTYGILQKYGEYARFLEEVNNKVDEVLPSVRDEISGLIDDTYEKCYQGMIDGVLKSETAAELQAEFKAVRAIRPEVVKAAVQNPIPKLRLNPTLERSRKKVISDIKREIAVGLSQGDRMSTMARRISNKVDMSYRQSMLIARTEAHRVRETGLNDAASEVDEILKANGSEYRKIKIWNTCEDASVRDTHAKMDGVAVLQDEKFELPSGATADCPGTTGIASEDCNCRCFVTHDIVTDSEFYALTGRHFKENSDNSQKQLTPSGNSGRINGINESVETLEQKLDDESRLLKSLESELESKTQITYDTIIDRYAGDFNKIAEDSPLFAAYLNSDEADLGILNNLVSQIKSKRLSVSSIADKLETAKTNRILKKYPKISGSHSFADDIKATNPKYYLGMAEYTRNCQRCVNAYEARRRGYDIIAKPRILNGMDTLPYMMDDKGWANVYKNGKNELVKCFSNSKVGVKNKVLSQMDSWGDGSRAIVRVQWSTGGGHVFVAENHNGMVHFIDPQSGDLNVERYFNECKVNQTHLLRIDNKEFTTLIDKCCEH